MDWPTALISGASAVGGGLVVAVSSYKLRRIETADAKRAELRNALAAFLPVLDLLHRELQIQPRQGRASRRVDHSFLAERRPWIMSGGVSTRSSSRPIFDR